MTERFTELGYRLPAETPEQYAEQAVTILKDLGESAPLTAAYAMEPSAVLALAGLRGMSPYHRFAPTITADQKRAFDDTLHAHNIYRMSDPTDIHFSLLNPDAVADIKNSYGFAADTWSSPSAYTSTEALNAWTDASQDGFNHLMESGELPQEWLKDDAAAQNLLFGMLLGYPGKAISSALWAGAAGDTTGIETLSDVLVADGQPYHGTHVSFDVHPTIIDSEEIIRLRKLWRKTIDIVYETLPFEELMKNEQFAWSYSTLDEHQHE